MRKAFSLVELSIVLVILGLLVGGVLSGQSLIHAASLRAYTEQQAELATAIHTFRDKYFAIPGDMTNATQFWGVAGGSGSDATCDSANGTGTQTCNGNGNGIIESSTVPNEYCRVWQHLGVAGLIQGNYSGDHCAFPHTKDGKTYWSTSSNGVVAANSSTQKFGADYTNTAQLGSALSEFLAPEDAWNIDKKMDDGEPGTGSVMSNKYDTATTGLCTTAHAVAADSPADYDFSQTGPQCYLYFLHMF